MLAEYRNIFTSFAPEGRNDKTVLAVVSSNRPREFMESQKLRYAGFEGRSAGVEIVRVMLSRIVESWIYGEASSQGLCKSKDWKEDKVEKMFFRADF